MAGPRGKRKLAAVRISPSLLRSLVEISSRRQPAVLVTVIESSGSAPGKLGAKMIVTARDRIGTVGGGKVEHAAVEAAVDLLGSLEGPFQKRYELVRDLGMSCGGSMKLLFEPMTPPPHLVVFGAGHVAEALCKAAALVGFDIHVLDERSDLLTEERFRDARERHCGPLDRLLEKAKITSDSFVVCVTQGHEADQETVAGILERGLSPRYLGVIGSRRKAEVFRRELLDRGASPEAVDAVRIPMGLPIGAVDPGEIAVSIVAELVAEMRGMEHGS